MIMQVNSSYSISNFLILLLRPRFIASKLQLYIPESITFLNCQCNVFWPYVAIIIAPDIKKECSYRNHCDIRLHAGGLEHSLMKERKISLYMFYFSLLCSAISVLDLGILKMLIRVCFRHVLQPGDY